MSYARVMVRAAWLLVLLLVVACNAIDDTEVDGEDWNGIARDRGFETQPDDFFRFAGSGCIVDLVRQPTSLVDVASLSNQIVLGEVVEVVPVARFEGSDDYRVRYRVAVDETLAGDDMETLLIDEPCAHAGKVAGMRNSIPSAQFLFILDGPYAADPGNPQEDEELAFALTFYRFGVVGESGGGLVFPYGESQELLRGLVSMDDAVAALFDDAAD
ncbi:MAG: hypothetical protein OXT09_13720 [Myxococcales bacterium]|nr:hypothetical protein [Myxococcales bacterium]